MLLQLDGSPHGWLEGCGPRLTLLVAIDDATNEVPNALFREEEDDAGYFELMGGISQSHGLPLAVYADRHTIFRSPKQVTLEQEWAGERPRSQFGRVMAELGVEMIPAYSPQAKGRVERLLGTLQDRLVKELREAGASTEEEANQVLKRFLPEFSARFGVPPAQPGSAYRPWLEDLKREEVLCFKHSRTVNNDNTISFDGQRLQIPPALSASVMPAHGSRSSNASMALWPSAIVVARWWCMPRPRQARCAWASSRRLRQLNRRRQPNRRSPSPAHPTNRRRSIPGVAIPSRRRRSTYHSNVHKQKGKTNQPAADLSRLSLWATCIVLPSVDNRK